MERRVRFAISVFAFQALAAAFFVADSFSDAGQSDGPGGAALSWIELGLAMALAAGVVAAAILVRQLFREARQREQALALARGALAEVVAERFGQWNLTRSEADVGLFALKGCSITEIARLRGSAEGTVRAQLSQVYQKAGVTSQPSFVALFIEELLS